MSGFRSIDVRREEEADRLSLTFNVSAVRIQKAGGGEQVRATPGVPNTNGTQLPHHVVVRET